MIFDTVPFGGRVLQRVYARTRKIIIFFLGKFKVRVKRNQIDWELDLREGIDLTIFIFNNFEKSILEISKKLIGIKKIDIIDIGSNMGVHTLNFAKQYKNSKIYSIEATNFAFDKLIKNINLNKNLNNIYLYKHLFCFQILSMISHFLRIHLQQFHIDRHI